LLLVRTEARRTELAVCIALGGSRARLAGGIAIEGSLLAIAGAALAVPVAWWLFRAGVAFQLPAGMSLEVLDLTLDRNVLIALFGSALLATLIISVVAGAFGISANVEEALRSRTTMTPPLRRRGSRAALLTGQIAVALVLLAGTGLFIRSIGAALRLNPGLDTVGVLAGSVNLTPPRYNASQAALFFEELQVRLRENPAVQAVAFSASPGGMSPGGQLMIDGLPRRFPSLVQQTSVDPDYFRLMRIPLLAGRDFSAEDRQTSPRVVIVSESFGRMISNGGNPIGSRITMFVSSAGRPPDVAEIVGVVRDVVTDVSTMDPLDMYLPIAQSSVPWTRSLAVRPRGDIDIARQEIIGVIKQIDPAVNPGSFQTLEETISAQMGPQKFGASVMGSLGGIAVLLTLLGTYVLAESMAVLRTREMGIRAAMGATSAQLGRIILRETLRLAGAGIAAGVFLTWLGAGAIRAFLFRVEPLDPITLSAAAILILSLAGIVSLRPALRAARVDVSRVLREE
jgi:putative ABC transport system permease protein